MKKRTLKTLQIIVTTLFVFSTTLILYESLCPANLSVITPVSNFIKDLINKINPPKVVPLEKIKITNNNEFVEPGGYYSLYFSTYPENATNSEVCFENLTPEYLDMVEAKFRVSNFPNDKQPQDSVAKIKAYSKTNPDIYDIYEFKIHKTHPDELFINTNLEYDELSDSYIAYLNEEAHFLGTDNPNKELNTKKYSSPTIVTMDDSYFSSLNEVKIVPKKIGETKISVYSRDFPEINKEVKINIKKRDKLPEPVELGLYQINSDGSETILAKDDQPLVTSTWNLALLDKDRKRVNVPFTLSLDEPLVQYYEQCEIKNDISIHFLYRGDIKLTANLYGDYEGKTIKKIFNGRHIYSTPKVSSDLLNQETMTIELPQYNTEIISVKFEKNTTFTGFQGVSSDLSVFSVQNLAGVRIEGLNPGTAYLTIHANNNEASKNGFNPVKIKVIVTTPMIKDQNAFLLRFRKGIGHMTGFLIDGALFTLMMWLWFNNKKRIYLMLSAIPIGFAFGGLSELLQMTQPSRGPSFIDVGIDFIGWMIGFTIVFIVFLIIFFIKRNKNKSKNVESIDEIPNNDSK